MPTIKVTETEKGYIVHTNYSLEEQNEIREEAELFLSKYQETLGLPAEYIKADNYDDEVIRFALDGDAIGELDGFWFFAKEIKTGIGTFGQKFLDTQECKGLTIHKKSCVEELIKCVHRLNLFGCND